MINIKHKLNREELKYFSGAMLTIGQNMEFEHSVIYIMSQCLLVEIIIKTCKQAMTPVKNNTISMTAPQAIAFNNETTIWVDHFEPFTNQIFHRIVTHNQKIIATLTELNITDGIKQITAP